MARVLALEPVVPDEKAGRYARPVRSVIALEPLGQLLPEARSGPVLYGVARRLRNLVALAAVQPDQLVAEETGCRRAVPAPADLVERKAEVLRDRPQPFDMPRLEMEHAALHAALGIDVIRVVRARPRRSAFSRFSESDAELVRQDLLRCTHAVQGVGVDHLVQLRDQELVREHRKLDDESPDL